MSLDAIRLASEASVRDVLLGICDDDRIEERALVYFARLEPQHATTVANTSALNSPSAYVDTLNQASEASIRAILIAVCNDPEAKDAALAYLAQLEPDTVRTVNNHPTAATRRVGKRKATGLAICVQCEEAFDESENGEGNECLYHAGEMKPHFEDVWSGIDQERYGEITAQRFGLWRPEGFVWSCCNRGGDEPGCRFGGHISDPAQNKHARCNGSSLYTSSAEEPEGANDAHNMGDDQNSYTLDSSPRHTSLAPSERNETRPTKTNTSSTASSPRPVAGIKARLEYFIKSHPMREGSIFDPSDSPGHNHVLPDIPDDITEWGQERAELEAYQTAAKAWERSAAQQVASRAERAARRQMDREPQ